MADKSKIDWHNMIVKSNAYKAFKSSERTNLANYCVWCTIVPLGLFSI